MYNFTCEHLLSRMLTDRDEQQDILQSGILSAETAEAMGAMRPSADDRLLPAVKRQSRALFAS